ncbi:hypothetical protein TI39_contig279g00026 [Zymoseptoria brevis]|uniref:Uncharacterized protein n=1 Tax=Zymoseptoria brevis TaxID=1047168 RepID=A0A0F4GWD7_9PEZI|nr:hypothetical protein TI39_contig279g00026 [Zymoseptoria brevis]
MAPPGLSGSGGQPAKSGHSQRKNVPRSSASHPTGITERQRKNMNRLQKAGKPVKSAEEYRAQLQVKLADQDQGIARRKNPIVKDNVPADCALEGLRRDKPSLYASMTTGAIPKPAKDDPHSARVIWFNDLDNKFTFNRHFTQARMLYAIIRYRHLELKHPISLLERQFAAACLEHDLGEQDRTRVREGLIDVWLNSPDFALPISTRAFCKRFRGFRKMLSETLPEVRMPVAPSSTAKPSRDSPMEIQQLYEPAGEEDELDKEWAQDDYNTRSWDVIMSDMYPTMQSNKQRSEAQGKKWTRIAAELSLVDTRSDMETRLGEMSGSLQNMSSSDD